MMVSQENRGGIERPESLTYSARQLFSTTSCRLSERPQCPPPVSEVIRDRDDAVSADLPMGGSDVTRQPMISKYKVGNPAYIPAVQTVSTAPPPDPCVTC
jgi:hypothetical protein